MKNELLLFWWNIQDFFLLCWRNKLRTMITMFVIWLVVLTMMSDLIPTQVKITIAFILMASYAVYVMKSTRDCFEPRQPMMRVQVVRMFDGSDIPDPADNGDGSRAELLGDQHDSLDIPAFKRRPISDEVFPGNPFGSRFNRN